MVIYNYNIIQYLDSDFSNAVDVVNPLAQYLSIQAYEVLSAGACAS